ncbi:MAG: 3-hydroxyacyl-CoA dehydrogenase NAD-binding domain-containing protein [bacterium]
MPNSSSKYTIGVIGAGTMGSGIAQVAATADHPVILHDSSSEVLARAKSGLEQIHSRLVEKGRIGQATANRILDNISYSHSLEACDQCQFVVEAIVENLDVKQEVFSKIEKIAADEATLATNTSSLSVTSIAAACVHPERVIGTHFFNPAPLMALVEIVPGLSTSQQTIDSARTLISNWGKTTVLAKDTPGFIVNRVARPFYGEAIRILEEGIADAATIDWAMREIGGFRMGPFELMDLIGNDVNLKVTETVFEAFFYDPRFRPSFTQKRMVEANRLGKKTGHGYYDYSSGATKPEPNTDAQLGEEIIFRILVMLINEAIDMVFLKIATIEDVDLAMTKGVNYPKGLLKWADKIGLAKVLACLQELQDEYGEDRYRPNPLLKRMVRNEQTFYNK